VLRGLGVQVPLFAPRNLKVQQTKSKKLDANRQIARSLEPWRFRVICGHLAALALGFVSACLGVVIGPALQVLLAPRNTVISWENLLGPVWSKMLSSWTSSAEISVENVYLVLPGLLVGVATVKSLLTFCQWYTWEWLGERLAFTWRKSLVNSFVEVSPYLRDLGAVSRAESHLGGLMTQDIRTCRDYVVHFFGGLPREGLQALFMAVSLLVLSPKLFLIFAFFVAPIAGLLNRLGKKIRRRAGRALEDNSSLGEWIQQRLLGIETIKQLGTEALELQSMRSSSQRLFNGFLQAAKVKSRTSPLIECLGIIAMSIALAAAFSDIATGQISGAVAMSFFASLALFAQSAAKLGRYFNSNREGVAAAERIFSAIHDFQTVGQAKIRSGVQFKSAAASSIRLSDVAIHYGEKIAVSQFSFEFKPGKLYCIVGSSGAGKSSVFNALLGLRSVDSGVVEYYVGPGFDDRSLDIAYLPQAVPLIPGKIAENVSYPSLAYDLNRVREALVKVGFSVDSERLSQGVETLVGASALQLSGGQLQRLQLARLVYHHAPFLLIDEGTSALDPGLEKLVLSRALEVARSGAVVIMIAHRRAAVDVADEVLVMEEGKIAVSGARGIVVDSTEFKRVFN